MQYNRAYILNMFDSIQQLFPFKTNTIDFLLYDVDVDDDLV